MEEHSTGDLEQETRRLEKQIVKVQPAADLLDAERRRFALATGDSLHRPVAETLRQAEILERVAEQVRQVLSLLAAYRLGENRGAELADALEQVESDILEVKHWFSTHGRFFQRSPMSQMLDHWRRLVRDIDREMKPLSAPSGDARERVRQIRKRNNRSWMNTQKGAASLQSLLERRAVELRAIRDNLGSRLRTPTELIAAAAPEAAAAQRLSLPFETALVQRAIDLVLAVPVGTPTQRAQVADLLKAVATSTGRSQINEVRKKCAELLSVDKYMDHPEPAREAVQSAHALVNAVLDELQRVAVG